jgi:hypothetical protein
VFDADSLEFLNPEVKLQHKKILKNSKSREPEVLPREPSGKADLVLINIFFVKAHS